MSVHCINPERQDPEDEDETLPEGWDEWKTSDECTHDYCIEVNGYARQYAAEAGHRESIALARADLDMPHAPERELMEAIQWRLK